jgi:hypothetical protein
MSKPTPANKTQSQPGAENAPAGENSAPQTSALDDNAPPQGETPPAAPAAEAPVPDLPKDDKLYGHAESDFELYISGDVIPFKKGQVIRDPSLLQHAVNANKPVALKPEP